MNTQTDVIGMLRDSVKKNPEGLLLLVAGVTLLFRSKKTAMSTGTNVFQRDRTDQREDGRYNTAKASNSFSRAVGGVNERVADLRASTSEKVSEYASNAHDYAASAGEMVVDRSTHLIEEAQKSIQSTVDRVVQRQPLAIVLAGLAAGAAVATVFPVTSMERNTLGSAGEKLTNLAGTAGNRLSSAAAVASDTLNSAINERGLNSDGLKEMVAEVSDSFEGALTGQTSGQRPQAANSSMTIEKASQNGRVQE